MPPTEGRTTLSLRAVLLLAAAASPAYAADFTWLGDLPGGTFDSRAHGVSSDGRSYFGSSHPDADFDGSFGLVNATDLAVFRTFFGKPPGPSASTP
jgi:hypothetical protein